MNPDNRALTGIQNNIGPAGMDASALGGTNLPYQFGDITRVNLGKGSEIAANKAFDAGELFMDNNAVGFNPFFRAPDTATKIFTA